MRREAFHKDFKTLSIHKGSRMEERDSILECERPFLAERDYPSSSGDILGRVCMEFGSNATTLSCCLPCPVADWIYSDDFGVATRSANTIAIIALVLEAFILLTHVALPKEEHNRDYSNVGLTISLAFVAIAFVTPLGTNPEPCYNAITPNDFHTDTTCAISGFFLELGSMGSVVWILLKSIRTAFHMASDHYSEDRSKTVMVSCGIALPLAFAAVSLPVAGVSYRVGNVCVPNHPSAMVAWFGWLLAFAITSALIQVVVCFHCLWLFIRYLHAEKPDSTRLSTSALYDCSAKHTAWRKAQKVLSLQWRGMAVTFVTVNLTIYFGIVFIQQVNLSATSMGQRGISLETARWFECLTANPGNKKACLNQPTGLGLSESRAAGTLALGAWSVGIIVSLFMLRASMFRAWWGMIRAIDRKLCHRPL